MRCFCSSLYNPEYSLKFKQQFPTMYPIIPEIIVKMEKMMSNEKKKKKAKKKRLMFENTG